MPDKGCGYKYRNAATAKMWPTRGVEIKTLGLFFLPLSKLVLVLPFGQIQPEARRFDGTVYSKTDRMKNRSRGANGK